MTQLLRIGLATAWLAVAAVGQDSVFINNGTLVNPQVDAVTFINNGEIETFSSLPWDTQGTLFFTNNGVMAGSPGYRLDHVPRAGGPRRWADSIHVSRTGSISGTDTGGFIFLLPNNAGFLPGSFRSSGSYVLLSATNVTSRGEFRVGPSGRITIEGENVDLASSTLLVDPLGGQNSDIFGGNFLFCSSFLRTSETNFFPDSGLFDVYWGTGTTTNLASDQIVFSPPISAQSPAHDVTNRFGGFTGFVSAFDAASWVFVDQPNPTNIVIQGVFVDLGDTNVVADVRFAQEFYPGGKPIENNFLTPIVQLSAVLTNAITLGLETNSVYLVDQLPTVTNLTILPNIISGNTFRPNSYIFTRQMPCGFLTGVQSNFVASPDLFWNPFYSSRVVTNIYAGYSGAMESLASRLPAVEGAGLTNLPGRVEIRADQLDLNRVRMRGQGMISIQAGNLSTRSTNSVVDSENLNFDLASRTGTLRVQSLAKDAVDRFFGNIRVWSGAWTNQLEEVTEEPDPNDPTGTIFVTNIIEIALSTTVLDARGIQTRKQVAISDFLAKARPEPGTVILHDNLTITNRFEVDADTLIVEGQVNLTPNVRWAPTNVINLKNLEVRETGSLTLPSLAHYGTESNPYESFVNEGSISAFSHHIHADYFENSGEIVSGQSFRFGLTNIIITNIFFPTVGPIVLDVTTAKLDGGRFDTEGAIQITGEDLKFNDYEGSAGGGVFFRVSDSLEDSGGEANNVWRVDSGFHLLQRPANSTMLGTTFESIGQDFDIIEHTWMAEDRGAVPAGYEKNAAVGRVRLNGVRTVAVAPVSQFVFSSPVPDSAIYVDELVLSGAVPGDLEDALHIEENITIYFAAVTSTDSENPVLAEELDGRTFGEGQIFWVKDFVGPNTSVDVLLSPTGPTIRVNRDLRNSERLDSDNDGIPNKFDDFPFEHLLPGVTVVRAGNSSEPGGSFSLQWQGAPGRSYAVEATDELGTGSWTIVKRFGSTPDGGTLRHDVQMNPGKRAQYFRVLIED